MAVCHKLNNMGETLKESAVDVIQSMPDDASLDEILEKIFFISQVREGLKDAQEGRVISTEQLIEKSKEW